MKIRYHEVDGAITEMTAEDYFRDKSINYEKSVEITTAHKAAAGGWISQNLYDRPSKSETVAMVGSLSFFNPFFKPIPYLESLGYKVIENNIPTTGAGVLFLEKA